MEYTAAQLAWIAFAVFLQGMNKGGVPVGPIALPILVLIWPDHGKAAREAVGFLLPLLCVMDMAASLLYRKDILWNRIWSLLPSIVVGVAVASALALSDSTSLVVVSDRTLKGMIGVIGLLFVAHRACSAWLLRHVAVPGEPGRARKSLFGFVAGVTSTLAHAAGPVMQMYYLPQRMPKMNYAATMAGLFLLINLVKVPFYVAHGRITHASLALNARMLVVIPFGVLLGYAVVRRLDPKRYVALIYVLLAGTSAVLTLQALGVA
jgi:hypothetical protein